jgi:hypothetical protein
MTQIRWEDLTREHLDRYSRIEAVAGFDDETFREVIWERIPHLSLVHEDPPGTEMRALFVRVPSLSVAWIERIRSTVVALAKQSLIAE